MDVYGRTGPLSILVGVLAVAVSAYMAAVYLAADAARGGELALAEQFRSRALLAGVKWRQALLEDLMWALGAP
jgi:hypothetical protein